MHIPNLLPLLLTILTSPISTLAISAPLKVVGQFECKNKPTNIYLCFDTIHYAICKSDYGYTNIYEVPAGKDWCAATKTNVSGVYATWYSMAFDHKTDSPAKGQSLGKATPTSVNVPPAASGAAAQPGGIERGRIGEGGR